MPAPKRILLVEDEPGLVLTLTDRLQSEGYYVDAVTDGDDAVLKAVKEPFDLVILDVMLPGKNGFDVCRELRQNGLELPVLFLTARGEVTDKVVGLKLGGDDYLTKPFHREELVARIHAIIRRSKRHSQSVITTGTIAVNLDAKTVSADNKPVHLTGKEYQMLELLSLRKGTTLTKEMFLNHLYGGMDEPELKIIDVFICKLRKKLSQATGGDNFIETVWGRGYVLRDPQPEEPEHQIAISA